MTTAADLIAALDSGHVSRAYLDVFDEEPLPADHPYRTEPRIVATPHVGYVTRESYRVFYEGAVESIRAWRDGSPIRVLT